MTVDEFTKVSEVVKIGEALSWRGSSMQSYTDHSKIVEISSVKRCIKYGIHGMLSRCVSFMVSIQSIALYNID